VVCVLATLFLLSTPLLAQDPNVCDEPGEAPDVIVGDLHQIQRYGTLGGITAYSVGTVSCNIGTCWLNWFSGGTDKPVIGQNMYRLSDGRYEQIGQSWLKHGFFALSETLCDGGCIGTNGTHLGVNCSDPYSAGLNGSQSGLGPRFEVNATTGEYAYPYFAQGQTGDTIYKRLQVHNDDLDPALNPGARYVVEGHYVTGDDAAAGNHHNNASWREIDVTDDGGGVYNVSFVGETKRQSSGVQAWAFFDNGVKNAFVQIPNDGRIIVAGKVTDLGNGSWRYSYAMQNLNSHRSASGFRVPVPAGSVVTNIRFSDVDYHSGEPYDGTDWLAYHDTNSNEVVWRLEQTYDDNPDANALRWGTSYSFSFDADAAPSFAQTRIDLFRPAPGDPDEVAGATWVPNICNNDGTCDAGETCSNCAADCINNGPSQGFCGDNVCEPGLGEDCLSCASDCNGTQSGNPNNRYCCGDGDGAGPVDCSDNRCTGSGNSCGTNALQVCCGDAVCDLGEDSCICSADCGAPPLSESICNDAFDQDCDGQVDCDDLDCCVDGACADGIDADSDGVAECDCDDNNNTIWETPSELFGLIAEEAGGTTSIVWDPPFNPGASVWEYEMLRSSAPANFSLAANCLLIPDPALEVGEDTQMPAAGTVFHYLVRAVNACPEGEGPLGSTSVPADREGRTCP